MTEGEFIEDVSGVCKNPAMYTPTGTFFEAVSYLEGYGKAHGVVKFSHSIFTPFLRWICKKFKTEPSNSSAMWNDFRGLFPSDNEALKNLPTLYEEYVYSSNQVAR